MYVMMVMLIKISYSHFSSMMVKFRNVCWAFLMNQYLDNNMSLLLYPGMMTVTFFVPHVNHIFLINFTAVAKFNRNCNGETMFRHLY
jgi:hypothetical protein